MIFKAIEMIPKFSSYFLPFLKILKEKNVCPLATLSKLISVDLQLTDSDLQEMTRGGSVRKHKSNINYCAAYLKKMGLVETPKNGIYTITSKGLVVLEKYGDNLNLSTLRELPEYVLTQYNPKNKDMVVVKPHKRDGKMIGAYTCRKESISKNNPHLYNPNVDIEDTI